MVLSDFIGFVDGLGPYGPMFMIAVFICLALPFVPGYLFASVACGYLFGFQLGLFTVSAGSMIGATLIFSLATRGGKRFSRYLGT